LLLLPSTIQAVHAFSDHDHIVCVSDTEHHFHADELDCSLCHLQAETHGILPNYDIATLLNSDEFENNKFYNYYHNHQHLSYSLRAPPIF